MKPLFQLALFFALTFHAAGPRFVHPGDQVTYTFTGIDLGSGSAQIVLTSQHGQKVTVSGTAAHSTLTFRCPNPIAFDEWQVADLIVAQTPIHLGAVDGPIFEVQR